MTYQQTLDYLFTKLPMYSRIGAAAFKEDLTNTIALCKALNNPQDKLRCIHVAGTNGKGSTSHMLAAVLQAAGYKTGLYTSPHLKDFRERIRIDGEWIKESFVVSFVEKIKPLVVSIEPSFFEITVAMAFDYFVQEQVDIAVIEVGLGGRLDSTNVITPLLSVITNIGWDHMQLLGNTLEKIAAEKAGIIKKGVPVILGEVLPQTKPVFTEKAAREAAELTLATDEWYVSDWHQLPSVLQVTVARKKDDERTVYETDLQGIYQLKNILTVLSAIKKLQQLGFTLPSPAIQKGLRYVKHSTGLHGRWDIIRRSPLLVLDVAHNEDGIRQLAEQLEITDHEDLHIIIGLVKDKEVSKVLSLLPKQAMYYFTKAQIPRALPEEQLAQEGAAAGLQGQHFSDVNTALQKAMMLAKKQDLVLVCGSVFVVGEADTAGYVT
ncbi:MAG TPA: folylpolyglutamate synthase/dihydrofolate synthase family protein [Chitinophagaceae bacterium]|nr:folylpolyglutamate synthase/dihydrofolate synthase family protein [Chitinophagaceae bacterium]